jgi:AcrR family transcriptional regulator
VADVNVTPKQNPYKRSLLARQNSVETRTKIVRVAARLWAEKGYDTTTVDEICAAAGIGRSTYYHHFESKEQLLGELTWATARATVAEMERLLDAGTIDRQIEAFIDGLSTRMASTPKDLAALVLRHAIAGIERLGAFPEGRVDFGLLLARVLERAQADGQIRDDVDPREVGAIMGGMTMEALLRWATGHTGATPLRDSLVIRFELVLDGIRL